MLSILEHSTLIASAPGGPAALRSLVIELAMRGLLTTAETADTPVQSLLEQMRSAKQQLLKSGQLKRLRTAEPVAAEDPPYPLPPTWRWIRLAEVGYDWGQQEPTGPFTYIDVGSLDNKAGAIRSPQIVSASDASSRARKVVRQGTLIYSTIRHYLLNVAVLDQEFDPQPIASTAFAVIHPYCSMPSRFFFWWLRSPEFIRYVESVQTGIAYPAINDAQFFNGLTPLPPLEEQHRIVAKVDELMALCDRLEAQQQDAEAAHARLVQALLDSLTQARDAEDFQACWQRVEGLFPDLFTTAASVDSLRRTYIQLGLRGLICPPQEADGDASELLEAIKQSKTRAWRAGVAPKPKAVSQISPADQPYKLPTGWRWVRLGQLGLAATGSTPPSSQVDAFGGSTPFIGPGQISMAGVISQGEKSLSDKGLALSTVAKPKDLLMVCIGGSIGKSAVADRALAFNQQINALTVLDASADYVHLAMRSPEFQQSVLSSATGSATPIINRSKWEELPVPLPPLAGQLRIVAKVTELLALCDQLKARIAAARAKHAQLAEALVNLAVPG